MTSTNGPGTPLGRLGALAEYARELGLCTGLEAKPAELFLIEEIERLRAFKEQYEKRRDCILRSMLNEAEAEIERLRADLLEVYNQLLHGGTKAHTQNALEVIRKSLHCSHLTGVQHRPVCG